jgi:hypothetical protein
MHGLVEAPGMIDPAELTEQTASGPGVALVLVARLDDGHPTRWLPRVPGSRAGGGSSGPIEDQSKASGRLDPTIFATHRFPLADTMSAYDTFADAASTNALKVVLQGSARDPSSNGHIAASLVAGAA